MYISKLRVKNYKSFCDSGDLCFDRGINIIIGPNNAGKTALLETLGLKISNRPHRSERTLPTRGSPIKEEQSTIEFSVTIPNDEIRRILQAEPDVIDIQFPSNGQLDVAADSFNKAINSSLTISALSTEHGPSSASFGLYQTKDGLLHLERQGELTYKVANRASHRPELAWRLLSSFVTQIYRFDAERVVGYRCTVGHNPILASNAANLAEVLQILNTRSPARFKRLNDLVSEVFSGIHWVAASMDSPTTVEVRIWPIFPDSDRDDLTLPLKECGSGIGQVLSILYVIVASEQPRTIIIDEPNSFLHPGAAKNLVQILTRFPEHQYFISTHSPEILATAGSATITMLQLKDHESVASTLNMSSTDALRRLLKEVGVNASDVLFAEKLIWAEGPTEAQCFPIILEHIAKGLSRRVTILPLVSTGDLKSRKYARKHAELIFQVYKRLSGVGALVPPLVGIVLDLETTTAAEHEALKRLGDGLLHLLPRRMYENYLLDPEAIAAVANGQDGFRDVPLSVDEVIEWLREVRKEQKYLDKPEEVSDSGWINIVDGAALLEDLFAHFSETRVEYRKTKHSVELTEWLIQNKSDELSELLEFLGSVIAEGKAGEE